jgi:single-strand DNA-binding protein
MPATIIIPGRITKDAEIRQAGNAQVVSFSVAVNCYENKEKLTRYYDCSWFGSRAISTQPHLLKGSAVTVTGAHSTREHNGKTYQKCDVWNVELMGGAKRDGQSMERSTPQPAAPQTAGGGYDGYDDAPGDVVSDPYPF